MSKETHLAKNRPEVVEQLKKKMAAVEKANKEDKKK